MFLVAGVSSAAALDPAANYEAEEDWVAALSVYLAVLDREPQDVAARKGAWRAAMRLGLVEQAAALSAPLDERERAEMEGDRIALMVRPGRIDANTLAGPERYRRLDAALAQTDGLAARAIRRRRAGS